MTNDERYHERMLWWENRNAAIIIAVLATSIWIVACYEANDEVAHVSLFFMIVGLIAMLAAEALMNRY